MQIETTENNVNARQWLRAIAPFKSSAESVDDVQVYIDAMSMIFGHQIIEFKRMSAGLPHRGEG